VHPSSICLHDPLHADDACECCVHRSVCRKFASSRKCRCQRAMPVPTDSERPVSPCGPCAAHAMKIAISHMFPADCAAIYVRFRASSGDLYTQVLH
jgi:hypothetical protein